MRKISILIAIVFISSFSVSGKKRIAWDGSSIMKVDDNIDYCRLKFLSDGNMAVVYRHLDGCKIKIYDSERICVLEKMVFSNKYLFNKDIGKRAYVLKANPEILELQTGRLLYVCNYRPLKEHVYPFSIASAYSDDHGITWSDPVVVYSADSLYENGCWEPAAVQLRDGRIQVYFANESPYRNSNEQEISMVESFNNGESWSNQVKCVSFSKGKRDGMPVPVVYGDSIYIAIEDNTLGKHQPSIVCSAIKDNWAVPVGSDSPKRINIMKGVFGPEIYGGAPYLAIDSKGVQYISCQSTYGRRNDMNFANLLVAVRDNGKIVNITYPFDTPLDKYGRWGAIELRNDNEIWATVSSNKDGNCVPYFMKGYILEDEQKLPKRPSLKKNKVFVGHKTNLSVWTTLSYRKGEIKIHSDSPLDISNCDSIEYYFYVPEAMKNKQKKMIKLCYKQGHVSIFTKNSDKWENTNEAIAAKMKGKSLDISFPYSINNQIRFMMIVNANKEKDPLVGTAIDDVNTWFIFKR